MPEFVSQRTSCDGSARSEANFAGTLAPCRGRKSQFDGLSADFRADDGELVEFVFRCFLPGLTLAPDTSPGMTARSRGHLPAARVVSLLNSRWNLESGEEARSVSSFHGGS